MNVRLSITVSEELLKAVDSCARKQKETRSTVVETALRTFIKRPSRDAQNARDLEIINQRAQSLNQEAREVLEYCRS